MRRQIAMIAAACVLALGGPASAAPPAKAPVKAKPAAKPPAKPVVAARLPDTPEIRALRRAFRFGFAPYEMLRTRQAQLAQVAAAGFGTGVNALIPRVSLADATTRDVTTPNNDTLYASAWLDLRGGPVLFTMPPLGRYHSASLMNITSDVNALVGTRTVGANGGRYAIIGPGWRGELPTGVEILRSQSNDAWLLVRVVVNGPEDLAAAADGLTRFTLAAVGTETTTPIAATLPVQPNGRAFITAVNAAIARSGDALLISRAQGFADQGIGKAWEQLSPQQQAAWNAYLPALINELKGGLLAGNAINGWVYPPFNMALYGDDDDLRSTVAMAGLAALPRAEAVYVAARSDGSGAALHGSKSWRLQMPAGLPVGGFWSLTMYEQTADGRLFFVPNALNRFAVGDRSRHLRPNRDGSIELFIQNTRPSGERVVNWLPAPKGRFVLMFRAYLPGAGLLDGSVRLPAVTQGEIIP